MGDRSVSMSMNVRPDEAVRPTGGSEACPDNGDGRLVIDARDLTRVYRMGRVEVTALAGVTQKVRPGEFVAIMGSSGSGKSTLMSILGCLDRPTSGTYVLNGEDTGSLGDARLAELRGRRLGFVFQSFNLLNRVTALANVELPMVYAGVPAHTRRERAVAALESVGLGHRFHHRPSELSGGERQRVAIARSLVNEPALILADEPTGNLDSKSGEDIMAIFGELNGKGITILVVTHEEFVARHAGRIIRLRDGKVVSDEPVVDRVSRA